MSQHSIFNPSRKCTGNLTLNSEFSHPANWWIQWMRNGGGEPTSIFLSAKSWPLIEWLTCTTLYKNQSPNIKSFLFFLFWNIWFRGKQIIPWLTLSAHCTQIYLLTLKVFCNKLLFFIFCSTSIDFPWLFWNLWFRAKQISATVAALLLTLGVNGPLTGSFPPTETDLDSDPLDGDSSLKWVQ